MKLQNFWWVLVVLVVIACGRTGTEPIDIQNRLSNITLAKVANDTIANNDSIIVSWDFDGTDIETGEGILNYFLIQRTVGDNYTDFDRIAIRDTTASYTLIDSNLTILNDFTYEVTSYLDSEKSESIPDTLFFNDVKHFRHNYEGIQILEPRYTETIEIELLNEDSLLVENDYPVLVSFLSVPDGTNINGSLNDTEHSLRTESNDGVLSFDLNAGGKSGLATIQLTTFSNAENAMIRTVLPNFLIQNPPETIKIFPAEADSAIVDGVLWLVDLAAYVEDTQEFPVEDSITVSFSLLDNQNIVSIEEDSYIGNLPLLVDDDGATPGVLPGTAYTVLRYSGMDTGKEVTIMAQCQDAVEIEKITLPMQYPYIDVLLEPEELVWAPGESRPKLCVVKLKLMDGLNYPLRGVDLTFYSEAGESAAGEVFDEDNPAETTTSDEFGNYGIAEVSWVFTTDEFELENGAFVAQREVEIIVTIPDTDYEYTIPVNLTRLVQE